MVRLDDSIDTLAGIGEKTKEKLEEIGIFTIYDALLYAPLRYEDRREKKPIASLLDGERTGTLAMASGAMAVRRAGGKTLYTQVFRDGSGLLRVTWQNTPYIMRSIRQGVQYTLYGRVSIRGGVRRMFAPICEPQGAPPKKLGKIVPVYPLGGQVTQTMVSGVIESALAAMPPHFPEILPEKARHAGGLMEKAEAVRALHRPSSMEEAQRALERLKFEELFLLFTGMQQQKKSLSEKKGLVLSCDMAPFFASLPFALTKGQAAAVEDIGRDMESGRVMNRLIEGDVGSGKTAVAAAALYRAAASGGQGLLMAPTTLLAAQHAATLSALLPHEEICLLTGKLSARERREAERKIADGTARVIVGTQAVLSEKLKLERVALVIVDEQHRFGVRQRGFLSGLSQNPHVLVMSATPIPRTLSLTLYGDLDISVLPARPKGRQAVETFAVPPSYRERIYRFIKKELEKGNRAYILCPLATDGGESGLSDVESYAAALSDVFGADTVLALHGKMRDKEKIMEAFSTGKPKVLVSTTVVEVGVDVPSATVIVIENAECFGLSQLHQLRGRVGRGTEKSYCILISEPRTKEASARLSTMQRTEDGFRIAEEDLRLRGPGEFFGVRQHGQLQLLYADVLADSRLLTLAHREAARLLAEDPTLGKYPAVREATGKLYARFAMN